MYSHTKPYTRISEPYTHISEPYTRISHKRNHTGILEKPYTFFDKKNKSNENRKYYVRGKYIEN